MSAASPCSPDRGGYPTRDGARKMAFTPNELRAAEAPWTQGWIQFETGEYILDPTIRDQVLDLMASQGKNKACGFIGKSQVPCSLPHFHAAQLGLVHSGLVDTVQLVSFLCGHCALTSGWCSLPGHWLLLVAVFRSIRCCH